ncbi:hypothetical protein QQ045_009083 [Rhodiola kirilowii]
MEAESGFDTPSAEFSGQSPFFSPPLSICVRFVDLELLSGDQYRWIDRRLSFPNADLMTSSCGNHETESARVEQIVTRFFSKCLHVILGSRCPCSSFDKNRSERGCTEVSRRDRWFNLALRDCRLAKQNTGVQYSRQMVVDLIFFHQPRINSNASGENCDGCLFSEGAVTSGRNNCCWDMKGGKVIERWVMLYEGKKGRDEGLSSSGRSHALYKKCVVMLRSLYLTLKLLPAYKLFRDLTASPSHKPCKFSLVPLISSFAEPFTREKEAEMRKYDFEPVETPSGSLCLCVLYLPSLQDLRIESSYQFFAHLIPDYFGGASARSVCGAPVSHDNCVVSYGLKSSGSGRKPSLIADSRFHVDIQAQLPANITVSADPRETSVEGVKTAHLAKCQCSPVPLASSVSPSCRWSHSLEAPSHPGLFPVGQPHTTTKTSPRAQMGICFCPFHCLSKLEVNEFQNLQETEDPLAAKLSDNAALGSLVNIFETAAPLCQRSVVQPNTGNLQASSTILLLSPAVKTSMDALHELQVHINMKKTMIQRSSALNSFDDQKSITKSSTLVDDITPVTM